MAGAGYKLFATGDVLTAAQVNTYLMQQTVMVFASSAARTTALSGVLAEGMVSYLQDTNATEVYDGSAWVSIGNSGDITGITTGVSSGLTGGVTSGTADLKFNTTAKGGMLIGTGSGTVSELAVGTNNYILTADSTQTTGVKWAAASSGNSITYATFVDQKNSGNDGGTATGGAWATRTLNTTINNGITSCTLSSNQISLPAGTYKVFAGTPAQQVGAFQCRLYNVTDSSVALLGFNAKQDSSNDTTTMAILDGNFTITGTKTFELQMYPQSTKNGNGFGSQTGNGSKEQYSFISIEKVG